ncbi:s-phase kinase-associated protein 1 [Nemania sp. NC0429]|nr:s-phase kinase-associated protein 1 [Nemania sp. NC0429]
MSSDSMVTLLGNDGVEVQATLLAVQQSITLKSMLEVLDEDQTNGLPIPLPEVGGQALRDVIKWCEYHRGEPVDGPISHDNAVNRNPNEWMPTWDFEFLRSLDKDVLFQVANASNYLDIPLLLHYTAAMIALALRGRSTVGMREYLNIENDMTPEEEERVRQENAWAFE